MIMIWASYQIFEKGRAWQDLNFKSGVAGKEGGESEIFNVKKTL